MPVVRLQKVHRDVHQYATNSMAEPTKDETVALSEVIKGSERHDSNLMADVVPLDAVSATVEQKKPPPETPEAIRLRIWVIASFWAIILLLGLPIWWRTTMVYRASLPLNQMNDWADGKVSFLLLWSGILLIPLRYVGPYFHFEYPLRLQRCPIRKLSIFYELLNMPLMT